MDYIKLPIDTMSPRIVMASFFSMPADYDSGIYDNSRSINCYLVIEGSLAAIKNEKTVNIAKPGQVISFYPGPLRIASNSRRPVSFYQVSFYPDSTDRAAIPWIEELGYLPLHADLDDEAQRAVLLFEKTIEALLFTRPGWQLSTKAAILSLVKMLFDREAADEYTDKPKMNKWERLLLSLDSDVSFPSTKTLAGRMNISTTHFINEFKKHTGYTPKQYILRRRLWKARQLLLDGSQVKQAAYQTGFKDQLYFSKMYKQIFGHPPSQAAQHQSSDNTYHKSALPVCRHIVSPEFVFNRNSKTFIRK